MNKIYIVIILTISGFMFSCDSNLNTENTISKEDIKKQIDSLKLELYKGISNPSNDITAKLVVKQYTNYAYAFRKDSISKNYLFECAQVNVGLGLSPEAIANLDTIIAWYPQDKIAPSALQFKAFILDDRMHRWQKAAEVLDELIAKYPNSDIVENAKAYKATLGKPAEQIIQEMADKEAAKE